MADQAEDLAPDQERVQDAAPDTPDQQEQTDAPAFDLEATARAAGWAPKDEWRGDDGQEWMDAPAFIAATLERGKAAKAEVKRLRKTTETLTRATERTLQQQREKALEQARREVRRAVEENDVAAADKAVQRVQEIEASRPDPAVSDFQARNADWFNVDDEATAYAFSIAQVHANRGADARTQLEEAEKAVKKRFPELFDAGEREKPTLKPKAPAMGGGQRTAQPRKGPLTLADLPREAQEAAKRMERYGVKPEQFVKNWAEENGR